MPSANTITAIEMGSSKIKVLVGEKLTHGLNIIGLSCVASKGIQKGEVQDPKAASECVHEALTRAEKSARMRIRNTCLALSGAHLEGFIHTGFTNIRAADNCISQQDIERVEEEARAKELSDERVYLHHVQHGFQLDGRPVQNPLGMQGHQLGLNCWLIHADENRVRRSMNIINALGMEVGEIIAAPLASGYAITTKQGREAGILAIDIGAGTTDWAWYESDVLRHSGVIAVGGEHFTNDLSIGLRLNAKTSEQIKINEGRAWPIEKDAHKKTWTIGDQSIGDRKIPHKAIQLILNARTEELFEIIKKQLKSLEPNASYPAGILLTGGAAQLPGLSRIAQRILEAPANIATPPEGLHPELRTPEFSTLLGLLHLTLNAPHHHSSRFGKKSLLERASKLLGFKKKH